MRLFHSARIVAGALVTAVAGVLLTVLFFITAGVSLKLLIAGRSPGASQRISNVIGLSGSRAFLACAERPAPLQRRPIALKEGSLLLSRPGDAATARIGRPDRGSNILLPFVGGGMLFYYIGKEASSPSGHGCASRRRSLCVGCLVVDARRDRGTELQRGGERNLRNPARLIEPLTRGRTPRWRLRLPLPCRLFLGKSRSCMAEQPSAIF